MFKANLNFALFDIKLKSPHKDLILIKGNEFECESIPVEGSIKLLIPEDIHIKKIKLSLVGEFSVDCLERLASGMVVDSIIERLCVLKVDWSNLLLDDEGVIIHGNYGEDAIGFHKVENMKRPSNKSGSSQVDIRKLERPQFSRSHSTPNVVKTSALSIHRLPKSGIDGTPFRGVQTSSNHSFFLPKGNYNIPFKVVLPANIGETVEGLSCASLLYKLNCTIERGRFEKPIIKSKHFRIIRTLHPQSLNLVDTIDIDNTWAGKIQYNVRLNRKGIAVGSSIPINLTFIPITKGITLKAIRGSVIQQFSFKIDGAKTSDFEQHLGKQELHYSPLDNNIDMWTVKTHFKVPELMEGINQTCEIRNSLIRVRHRLRLSILLHNMEGHTSELRANLPIHVYISANMGHVRGKHYEIDPNHGNFIETPSKEDIFFKKDKQRVTGIPDSPREPHQEDEEIEELDLDRVDVAPPLYDQHVNDPLFDSTKNQTPLEQIASAKSANDSFKPSSAPTITGYFDIPERPQKPHTPSLQVMNKIPTYEEALDEEDEIEADPVDLSPSYDENVLGSSLHRLEAPTANFEHFRSKLEGRYGKKSASSSGTTTPTLNGGKIDETSSSYPYKSPIHLSLVKMFAKRK